MAKYDHLERACGGAINPESLENFRRAIPQFHNFMQEARAFFAPRGKPGAQHEHLGEEHDEAGEPREPSR